jgi:hypothetical protein
MSQTSSFPSNNGNNFAPPAYNNAPPFYNATPIATIPTAETVAKPKEM